MAWWQPRRFLGASAASNCVSLEFYYAIHCALAKCPAPQHAKSFHHVFSVLNVQRHPKGLREVYMQAHLTYHCVYTAIMWVAWAWQQSSSGAAGDPTTLPRQPHFVSTACLSERRTTTVLCITKNVEWHSLGPYYNRWRCHSIVAPL